MIKRSFIKIMNFLSGTSFWRNFLVTLFLLALLIVAAVVSGNIFNENIMYTITGAALGFALSNILISFAHAISNFFEDMAKVSGDTKKLLSIYRGSLSYKKTLDLNGTQYMFIYNELLINQGYDFVAKDDMNKSFELDEFFNNFYGDLFESHASSAKENSITVRLDSIEKSSDGGTYTFYLSRSTFYNHLVTNRAIDFEVKNDLTIRSIFEHGPFVTPLEESKLSNHIGINALVFLDDGSLLLPQRRGDSTISKHCVTASIATRLMFPNASSLNTKITTDYLFRDNIYENLKGRISLDFSKYDKKNVELKFLGVGQNIYEGGKPQMYFTVTLRGLNKYNLSDYTDSSFGKISKIDVDKCVHIVDYSKITFQKKAERIIIHAYNPKTEKYKKHVVGFEKSLMCNIWHYQEDKMKNLVLIDVMGILFDDVLEKWFIDEFGKEEGAILAKKYCATEENASKTLAGIIDEVSKKHNRNKKKIYKKLIDSAKISKKFISMLRELKKHNRIALTSNAPSGLIEAILKKHKLSNFFDAVYPSHIMGFKLQNEGYFKKILSFYNRSFENIYFIDSITTSFDMVNALGIIPMHYTDQENCMQELKERNLL